jgi:hypothetical protein
MPFQPNAICISPSDPPSPLSALPSLPQALEDIPYDPNTTPALLSVRPMSPQYIGVATVMPLCYKGWQLVGADGSDPGVFESSPILDIQSWKHKEQNSKHDTWIIWEQTKVAARETEAIELELKKNEAMKEALKVLENASLTFGDLCLFVFDLHNLVSKGWWWDNFYKSPEVVDQVLLCMVSKLNSKLAHRTVERGMIKIIEEIIEKEANVITKHGVLRPPDNVDADFIMGMKFGTLLDIIKEHCLTMFQILSSIVKTPCQAHKCTEIWLQHKSFVSIVDVCLYTCSPRTLACCIYCCNIFFFLNSIIVRFWVQNPM